MKKEICCPLMRAHNARAKTRAAELSRKHAGVIAWARDADPKIGEYGEPVEIARYGDVPDME